MAGAICLLLVPPSAPAAAATAALLLSCSLSNKWPMAALLLLFLAAPFPSIHPLHPLLLLLLLLLLLPLLPPPSSSSCSCSNKRPAFKRTGPSGVGSQSALDTKRRRTHGERRRRVKCFILGKSLK